MIALLLGLALAADPVEPVPTSDTPVKEALRAPTTQVSAYYVLKVSNRGDALDAIVAETRRLGGWFARLSDDEAVDLRIPVEHVEALQAFLEAQGLVADRNLGTVDVRREVAELDARLDSQRHLVEQYLTLMGEAQAQAVFQLEHELTYAISQVESLEGRKRLLLDRAATASISVAFQFRDRRRSNEDRPSPFGWVNTLDVRRALDDLRYPYATTARRPGLGALEVDGMATYRRKKEFRATSPDGVVVRTRAFKHKPRADLSFWSEAVQTHLVGQGYILQRDEALGEARWLEWAVPSSTEELTYVTAIRPNGRKLELVEVAGTAERVEGRRDAVLVGLKQVLGE
jgi:hypothetical protein